MIPKVQFGSEATITAVVSSIPEPEHVKWQKSKDGNNFYCIDVTETNYCGDYETPLIPSHLLVIPKATFDDKLYYRLLVKNKIRESISDTVYLNVTGSMEFLFFGNAHIFNLLHVHTCYK